MNIHKWQRRLTKAKAYSLATAIFLFALLLRFLLLPVEAGLPFLIFYPAMVYTFAICGIAPGYLFTLLSAVAGYFFFIPDYFTFAHKPTGELAVFTFLLSAYVIARVIAELRNTAAYLHDLLHNSPAAIVTIDPKTQKLTSANPVALKLWGYSAKDMLTKTITDLTAPEDLAASRQGNPALFSGDADKLYFEKPYRRQDGSTFWAETYASSLKDASGKVQLFIGNTTDITERKQIQSALEASEQRYHALLEEQTELICRFKADGTILYVNAAYCRFFALDQSAVLGRQWQPVVFEEDLAYIQQQLNTLNPEHRLVTIENRVYAGGGMIRWVQFINRVFFDEQGQIAEYQAVGRDITDRKAAEAHALQLQDLLTKTAHRLPGVIYQFKRRADGSSCFPFASAALHDVFGVSPEQVREDATPIFASLYPEDLAGVMQSIQTSADTLSLWRYEYRVKSSDGRLRWLLGNAMPNREADGSTLWHGYITDITERKQIELALQIENEKNIALLRNASDGIFILNQSHCIIEVSDSFCSLLGYTREEVIGMHILQWDAGFCTSAALMSAIKQQFASPDRCEYETLHRRKDGSLFAVEVSSQALVLAGQTVLFNSARDISKRKQLADKLVKSNQEITDLYEYAPCGYHSLDKDGIFLRINATELAWLGCSKQELIGKKKVTDFFTPAGQALFEKSYPEFLKNGAIEGLEFEIVAPDKPPRFIRLDATAVLDDNGAFVMSRSVLYDITHTKKIQDALGASEQRFRMLANSAPVLIWMAGLDKACNWFNKVWLDFTGRNMAQELGNGWAAGVHPDDLQRCLDIYTGHFDRCAEFNMEYRLRRHDGVYRWIVDHGVPLINDSGHFSGYIGSCIDITDSKALTLQLQTALRELESKSARLETILKYASDGIHILDINGNLLQFSDSFARMLGYAVDEMAHLNVKDWDAQIPSEEMTEVIKKLLSTSAKFESRHRRQDGTEYEAEIHASAVTLDGKICLYASARDISERKQSERKLKQLSLEQQAMLDNDLVAIIKVQNRRIQWKNKAMDRIFGYESHELIGADTRVLYSNSLAYQALGAVAYPVLHSHGVYRTQLEMRRKDGEKIWIDLSGVLLSESALESLWMIADITLMKRHEAEVEEIAYHDILTGLPNRLLVADRLTQALAHAERTKRLLAVCYLDLDGFKPINDNYGHPAGDLLLKEIAVRMLDTVRANDTVGRLGGDEFVLLLTDLENVAEYQLIVERLAKTINQPIWLSENQSVNVGVSIGISVFPEDSNDPETLLQHADRAMYQAKQSGRNRVCLFNRGL